ncbi:ABC transporter substrate-binding protein [Herbaspirillum sp. LeCh32-8]|uniref:ABC transporter substrate-binding protein n=1 Tax=Herbaspirillum sp. LeCh32-8 TaxID=2821356 RepID=UPI001AE4E85B|nr:ABC transporter substrate-binding protein [Herbaspirillum sp. LeCh32-8]MBP0596818.1 ABC transporter substrate-binding protein [Herbaspirillum sp. LeCh32-8]
MFSASFFTPRSARRLCCAGSETCNGGVMPTSGIWEGRAPARAGRSLIAAVGLWLAVMVAAPPAHAEPGIFPDRVVIGQSTALTGRLSSMVTPCFVGAKAYFSEVNAQGGVYGRRIELQTRDDANSARQAQDNTEAFIRSGAIFALFGYGGWVGSEAALTLATKARIPFLFPCSGALPLYDDFNRYVFTIRASYLQEYLRLFHLFERFGVKRVTAIYQKQSEGERVLAEVQRHTRGSGIVVNKIGATVTSDFHTIARQMMLQSPDGVLLVNGNSAINASIVRSLRAAGYLGRFFGASPIGQKALADDLGQRSRGVVVTQVAPSPWHFSMPLVVEYRRLMAAAGLSELSFGSMEGFIAARVFVEALRRAGPHPTREKLIKALEGINDGNYALGGFAVNFSPTNHHGSSFVDASLMAGDATFVN